MRSGTVAVALLACILLSSCIPFYRAAGIPLRAHCIGTGVSSVSASQNSSRFVVSYCDEKKSLIAIGDFSSEHADVVLESRDSLFYRPIFLGDEKSLVFIERKTVDKSAIELIDANGVRSQLTQPGENMENIQDMSLSRDNSTIYYINARAYANYSPLAPATERDMDFFSLSMRDKRPTRLSFLDKYNLNGISVWNGSTLFSRNHIVDLAKAQTISTSYDPAAGTPVAALQLAHTSASPLSAVSKENQMVLSSGKASSFTNDNPVVKGYGLYLIQLPDRNIVRELTYLPSQLDSPSILEKENVVLFIRSPLKGRHPKRELWSVHLDGTGLKKVSLAGLD